MIAAQKAGSLGRYKRYHAIGYFFQRLLPQAGKLTPPWKYQPRTGWFGTQNISKQWPPSTICLDLLATQLCEPYPFGSVVVKFLRRGRWAPFLLSSCWREHRSQRTSMDWVLGKGGGSAIERSLIQPGVSPGVSGVPGFSHWGASVSDFPWVSPLALRVWPSAQKCSCSAPDFLHLFLASGPPRKFGQPLKDPGPKKTWSDFDVQLVIQHVDFDVLRCNHGLSIYLSFSGPFP